MNKMIFIATALVICSIALAVDETVQTVETTTEIAKPKKRQASLESRAKSHASAQAGMGIITTNLVAVLEGNYIVNEKLALSLRLANNLIFMENTGSTKTENGTTTNYKPTIEKDDEDSTSLIMAGVKFFPGNTFYLRPELYYRTQDESVKPDFSSSRTARKKYDDVGLSFSVGNEWQFGHFVFGVDWGGLAYKLLTVKSNGVRDRFEVDSEKVAINILNLHIGFSF
jgi:hypothetical protein